MPNTGNILSGDGLGLLWPPAHQILNYFSKGEVVHFCLPIIGTLLIAY